MRPASELDARLAEAIIGLDTLWGGDVMSPSGTARFIADSWFSDLSLPASYTHPAAARLRETGGLSAESPDGEAVGRYLKDVDVAGAVRDVAAEAPRQEDLRRRYLEGLALCLEVMWDLAMERLDRGDAVPYERCVRASTGAAPEPSRPGVLLERLGELLGGAGYPADDEAALLASVDAWRADRMVPAPAIPTLASAFIAQLDGLTARHVLPFLPDSLHAVPRANVAFLPIRDAWFSGSMNYLGRARTPEGRPEFEASYEINASLEISVPEFQQLVSHEVVPGHVTTFALLQELYERGQVGFEATVLTMNTRGATLFEGIANNAILMAHGVDAPGDLGDPDLEIGLLLALLQDDAKNQASYLRWSEGVAQPDVQARLRRDFVVSEERAAKLSGPWAGHPILGRMYLPAYRSGTQLVARLRRDHRPEEVIPALYGCRGLVDAVTVEDALG